MYKQIKAYKTKAIRLNKRAVATLTLNEQQAKLIAGGGTDIIRTTTSKDKICTTLTQLCTGSSVCAD